MHKRIILALLALCLVAGSGLAERIKYESEIAEAVELMDEGKFAPSIRILRGVLDADSTHYYARYELGYAYFLCKNYSQAVKVLEPIVNYPEANDQTFSLLGSAIDMAGDSQRALDVYAQGLKRFPKSGKLSVEVGTMALIDDDSETALKCYMNAVKVEPDYTPGIYRSALLLSNSDNPALALDYSEMFFAKEGENKQRLMDVSGIINDQYRSVLRIDGDTLTVHFPEVKIVMTNDSPNLDFEKMLKRFDIIYGMSFEKAAKSIGKADAIDVETLCRLRSAITDEMLTNELIADSTNPYLLHLKAVRASGCENAYNHYVLLFADQPAFKRWVALHPLEWQKFADWYDSYDAADGDYNFF